MEDAGVVLAPTAPLPTLPSCRKRHTCTHTHTHNHTITHTHTHTHTYTITHAYLTTPTRHPHPHPHPHPQVMLVAIFVPPIVGGVTYILMVRERGASVRVRVCVC